MFGGQWADYIGWNKRLVVACRLREGWINKYETSYFGDLKCQFEKFALTSFDIGESLKFFELISFGEKKYFSKKIYLMVVWIVGWKEIGIRRPFKKVW